MKKDRVDTNDPWHARRTGIDRRWIASPGHRPERRRGGDRRASQTRSFLARLDEEPSGCHPVHFSPDDPPVQAPSPGFVPLAACLGDGGGLLESDRGLDETLSA